nr:hypothetical protein [Tanacetum cinerariifolium]
MNDSKSFNKHPTNQTLYHALMEALIADEEAMDKSVADLLKQQQRLHGDEDEDPFAGPNQGKKTKRTRTKESESSKKTSTTRGKAPTKGSKSDKSAIVEETIEELINELIMDDVDNTAAKEHKVYSTQKILSVKVEKLHGYGHLEEIVVRSVDRQPYKFKEESYQKRLNLTKPKKTFPRIEFKELYTLSFDPPEVIYEDLNKQKKVMQTDELYKFSDVTLKTVRHELNHRLLNFQLGYNDDMPRRKWSVVDKRRTILMVNLIDKHMIERWIVRNMERLVSARELEMDYRLMTCTE